MARIQTKHKKLKKEKLPVQAGRKVSGPSESQKTIAAGAIAAGAIAKGAIAKGANPPKDNEQKGKAHAVVKNQRAPGKSVGKAAPRERQITDQEILELLLEEVIDEPTDYGAQKIQSLKKAGKESDLAGMVVTMEDGSEYHVLIRKMK